MTDASTWNFDSSSLDVITMEHSVSEIAWTTASSPRVAYSVTTAEHKHTPVDLLDSQLNLLMAKELKYSKTMLSFNHTTMAVILDVFNIQNLFWNIRILL